MTSSLQSAVTTAVRLSALREVLSMDESQSRRKLLVDELKQDRSYVRRRVERRVQKLIMLTAKGGYYPSFAATVKETLDEISKIMDENREKTMSTRDVLLSVQKLMKEDELSADEAIAKVLEAVESSITIDAWSIILQEKEPDRYCDKTMNLIGESCPTSNVADAESTNPHPSSNETTESQSEAESASAMTVTDDT